MWRFLVLLVALLYIVYYMTVILHYLGIVSLTCRRMTFIRNLVPFYYWIAPRNEKPKRKRIVKPIKVN